MASPVASCVSLRPPSQPTSVSLTEVGYQFRSALPTVETEVLLWDSASVETSLMAEANLSKKQMIPHGESRARQSPEKHSSLFLSGDENTGYPRYDPEYAPGLLLQPDTRPISEDHIASEGMNTDHPLKRDFLELQRKTAKGYTCPVCGGLYQAEPKLWDHGFRNHSGYLEGLGSMEKAEAGARRRYRQEALDQTQRKAAITDKAGTDRPIHSRPAPDRSSPTEGNATDKGKAESQTRSVSAPGHSQNPENRIEENIEELSLEQSRSKVQNVRPLSMSNPRKRGAEGESRSPGASTGGHAIEPTSNRTRHGKTLSGGRDPDFIHHTVPQNESDYARGDQGPKQPLWDPNSDSPNTNKVTRKSKPHGHANPLRRFRSPKNFYSTYQDPQVAEKEIVHHQLDFGYGKPLVQQAFNGQGEQSGRPFSPEAGPENHSSEAPLDGEHPGYPHDGPEDEPEMLLQPETRPISHEQLVVEVKGIYAGLVMVEAKCIDIDERQNAAAQEQDLSKKTELKNDQWQSLIALHKQLLHEHHDFFLASQHPSASQALSRLVAKYSMPARMWRYGIHAFLEVLRHRLPDSLEHMLAFIYIAYSTMALLYKTIPAFEDIWIECLGDLGRYRMAIEDDEPRDREVWSNVAKSWYNKASDKTPNVGRLYHHLAILARPYTLEQLSLYTRSLIYICPFESAKGSIMTLFNPILQNLDLVQRLQSSFETDFINLHAMFFIYKPADSPDLLNVTIDALGDDDLLDKYINRVGTKVKEFGAHAATSNIAALFEYGTAQNGVSKSGLRVAYENAQMTIEKAMQIPASIPNEAAKSSKGPPQPEAGLLANVVQKLKALGESKIVSEAATTKYIPRTMSLAATDSLATSRSSKFLPKFGTKIKQGIAGFANGSSVSAMADTGSRKNIISASYAAKLGLKINTSPSSFTIGSSRQVQSVGTVSLSWSFAGKPKESIAVICHVLPRCIYDLILGNGFLTVTETMSKYRNRLSKCVFSMVNRFSSIAFLGETSQRLGGILADTYDVLAVPDSGAERHVMSLQYAIANNLNIKSEPEYRNWLQFADESIDETVGQVDTYWTFANGERIPLTFEILEDCCSDVIIGEEILTNHNVFQDHESSLVRIQASEDSYELAPFDFISGWQRAFGLRKGRESKNGHYHEGNHRLEEQRRRDVWNFRYDYGANAAIGEKELEIARRSRYDSGLGAGGPMPKIPSIPSAPSRMPAPPTNGRTGGWNQR